MIKIYKMRKGVETLLKEYKTVRNALDFIENYKNYDYILYAIKGKHVIAFQSYQPKKKMLDFFEMRWYTKRKGREKICL